VNVHRPVVVGEAVASCGPPTVRVCFLYIAQAHQTLHSLSAAVELARQRPDIAVDVAAASADVLDYAQVVVALLGGAPLGWRLLGPAWLRALGGADGVPPKLPMLAANARILSRYDVIVAPERTTAALRRMGVSASLVYTQHGAGDRAGPFEPRLRQFDLVFAAGAKQRDRMISEGLVTPERCAVVGYPKFDLVDRLRPGLPKLFANDRPIVLYNPHFSPKVSSWPLWGLEVLRAFAGQQRYNLIFAPHLRLFDSRPPAKVACLAPFLGHSGIHMDLGGTSAAIDMTYTRLADVYVGDASSQVYEFLREPRPCLFLDPHATVWDGDESFRHWESGPVATTPNDLVGQIDRARRTHPAYRHSQLAAFHRTFDLTGAPASVRAADAIASLCQLGAPRSLAAVASGAQGRAAGERRATSPIEGRQRL